jgi:hypothetical protein
VKTTAVSMHLQIYLCALIYTNSQLQHLSLLEGTTRSISQRLRGTSPPLTAKSHGAKARYRDGFIGRSFVCGMSDNLVCWAPQEGRYNFLMSMGSWFVQLAHITLFGLGFFLYNGLMSPSKQNVAWSDLSSKISSYEYVIL